MEVNKILSSTHDSFTVYRYSNGFMVEVSGNDINDDWKTLKVMCSTEEDLLTILNEILSLPVE